MDKINFEHTKDSYLEALGISKERHKKIHTAVKDNIYKLSKLSTKSITIEKLMKLIKPESSAEYFLIGTLCGHHEAQTIQFAKMMSDFKEKHYGKKDQDSIDDF